jgi:AcrR family transcriptional regulator
MTVDFGRCVMRLDEGDLSGDARAEIRARKKQIDRRLRAFVMEGIEDGSITPCDPKLAAFSIAGALNWICMWYEPDGALSPEEIATQFARTLTQGLARERQRA